MLLEIWYTYMTRSMTLSPSDKLKSELALSGFLEGNYRLEEIAGLLRDYLGIDFGGSPMHREITYNALDGEIEIEVDEHHVRRMLEAYLAQKVTGQELSNWAAFIFMAQVFVPKGNSEAERLHSGEGPVWDVLQRLMTPDIFGGLSFQLINGYLDLLQ